MSDTPPQQPESGGQPPQSPYAPPSQSPYGEPPAAPQQQWAPPAPYGQGQSPYGETPPPYQQVQQVQQPTVPRGRPGTVTAACVTAMVMSGLTALFSGLLALLVVVAQNDVLDMMRETDPTFDDSMRQAGIDPGTVVGVVVGVLLFLVVWCLIAVGVAAFAMRRSNVARILLVVSSVMTALLSLLAISSLVTVVPLVAAIAVIVLLFVGGANEWYQGRA